MKRSFTLIALLLLASITTATSNWDQRAIDALRQIADPLFNRGVATEPHFDDFQTGMVEALPPQARAERALELTINRFVGASDYVRENAPTWHGQITETPTLTTLITTALNSPQIETRMAGLELHLAQYSLEKTPEQIDHLYQHMLNDPEGNGPWVLWSIASIGALGIDRERIFNLLSDWTNAKDEPLLVRQWAVNSLAKFGGAEVVDPLLSIAASDAEPIIRERAFCGIAQSGTLHISERYLAIPGLLDIAKDQSQSEQVQGWAYQALREITNRYDLPEDELVWAEQLSEMDLL